MEQERRREAEEERRRLWDGGKRKERGVVVTVEEKVGREGGDESVGFLRREDAIGDDCEKNGKPKERERER